MLKLNFELRAEARTLLRGRWEISAVIVLSVIFCAFSEILFTNINVPRGTIR